MVLPSATFDHRLFSPENHASVHVVLERVGAAGVTGAGWKDGAVVATGVAGACAGWLVQPDARTARTSRLMQEMYKTFILNEEFVFKNKHNGFTLGIQ